MIKYGRLFVRDVHLIDDAFRQELKLHYSTEAIILLTSFAGLMIATNLINTVLNVPVDDYLLGHSK